MTRSVVTAGSGASASTSPSTGNWASGTFGSGLVRIHGSSRGSYSFTVPAGISSVRVRVWGAGGGGAAVASSAGGGGGGFSIGEFTVVAGTAYAITVGAGGEANTTGGTSSFGALISATGGASANSTAFKEGGLGAGGYANHYGGGSGGAYCGGGGSASLFGHGGDGIGNGLVTENTSAFGLPSGGAGGGVGSSGAGNYATGNMGGLSGTWNKMGDNDAQNTSKNRTVSTLGSIDMLGTGTGGVGDLGEGFGSNGGGGGGRASGGWPGGGGGCNVQNRWGVGADGCVIVEY
tara:strand:- start:15 stop:887 length:873 start_codon:yes stop_codon:yes gene_type:complete